MAKGRKLRRAGSLAVVLLENGAGREAPAVGGEEWARVEADDPGLGRPSYTARVAPPPPVYQPHSGQCASTRVYDGQPCRWRPRKWHGASGGVIYFLEECSGTGGE